MEARRGEALSRVERGLAGGGSGAQPPGGAPQTPLPVIRLS